MDGISTINTNSNTSNSNSRNICSSNSRSSSNNSTIISIIIISTAKTVQKCHHLPHTRHNTALDLLGITKHCTTTGTLVSLTARHILKTMTVMQARGQVAMAAVLWQDWRMHTLKRKTTDVAEEVVVEEEVVVVVRK